MKTGRGPCVFLSVGALAILRTTGTRFSVLLSAITVLGLVTRSQITWLIRTVLTIVQALPLPGSCAGVLSPESCCHYACRHEDECDNRTDYDFLYHGLLSSFGCRPAEDFPSLGMPVLHHRSAGEDKPFLRHAATRSFFRERSGGKKPFCRRFNASFSCLIYSISTIS
jgi:hypothetical protein